MTTASPKLYIPNKATDADKLHFIWLHVKQFTPQNEQDQAFKFLDAAWKHYMRATALSATLKKMIMDNITHYVNRFIEHNENIPQKDRKRITNVVYKMGVQYYEAVSEYWHDQEADTCSQYHLPYPFNALNPHTAKKLDVLLPQSPDRIISPFDNSYICTSVSVKRPRAQPQPQPFGIPTFKPIQPIPFTIQPQQIPQPFTTPTFKPIQPIPFTIQPQPIPFTIQPQQIPQPTFKPVSFPIQPQFNSFIPPTFQEIPTSSH